MTPTSNLAVSEHASRSLQALQSLQPTASAASGTLAGRLLANAPLAALPFVLGGCNGAYVGNLVVLAVSIGVFYGTLTLQRGNSATRSRSLAESSQAADKSKLSGSATAGVEQTSAQQV